MEIQVLYFASLQDAAGVRQERVTVADAATVADCVEAVGRLRPAVGERLSRSRVAVNGEFSDPARALASGDEVALLPPMSGG